MQGAEEAIQTRVGGTRPRESESTAVARGCSACGLTGRQWESEEQGRCLHPLNKEVKAVGELASQNQELRARAEVKMVQKR